MEANSPCGIMLRIKICDFIPQGEAGSAGYQYFHELNVICLMLKKVGRLGQMPVFMFDTLAGSVHRV